MAINKVIYGDSPLIDLTADTVTPETLVLGATAHSASGEQISGNVDPIGLHISGASVDDLVRVATVDASGKPTSWAPITQDEVTNTSVKVVAQTFTDAQKAQARSNINAADESIYTDDGVDIGSGGVNNSTDSVVIRNATAISPATADLDATHSVLIQPVIAKDGYGQLHIGMITGFSNSYLNVCPWLLDYATDFDGVKRMCSESRGINAVVIGASKAIGKIGDKYFPSFAIGNGNVVTGAYGNAMGQYCFVSGWFANAFGDCLINSTLYKTVVGSLNSDLSEDRFEVGNGTMNGGRSNAFRVTMDGKAIAQNALGIEDGQGSVVELSAAQLQTLKDIPTNYRTATAQDVIDAGKLSTDGDGSNVTAAFTATSTRTNLSTGEKLSVLFGKIAKWFADLGSAAFRNATSSVAQGSTDLVESGAVYTGLEEKYEKPAGGIPDSDIASASTWNAKGTYSKPSSGIPESDLSQDVQAKLNSGTSDALPLAGGTMEGDIDMDGNSVTGLPTPTNNSDAVPKNYADGLLTGYRTAAAQDDIDANLMALGTSSMSVGDLVRVAAVDANGKPTSWAKVTQDEITNMSVKADELAIVINGNTTSLGAAKRQYVILRNSTISGKADGLYTAAKAIPANTAIDETYLTGPIANGGLNAVMSNFTVTTSNLTPNTNIVQTNYGMSVIKSGSFKIINLICALKTISSTTTFSTLCTIPSGYLPATKYEITAIMASKTPITVQMVANDNHVHIRPTAKITAGDTVSIQITYI